MKTSTFRRSLLLAAVSAPLVGACASRSVGSQRASSAQGRLSALEASSGGRLGVAAIDTGDGTRILHRADERFAFCSTFKVILISGILKRSEVDTSLLQRRITYTAQDVVNYSPITKPRLATGMTVAELCAAALDYSDNTAANLLIAMLGGPEGVTAFARSIGDDTFRLDRRETVLNTAIPGDLRDTSTPASMMGSLRRLALGDVLAPSQRDQLLAWMRANTTGGARIRAGVPADWQVADKTGTGDYGTTNDLGVVWRPSKAPLVVAIYFTQTSQDASARDGVVASAARIIAETLG